MMIAKVSVELKGIENAVEFYKRLKVFFVVVVDAVVIFRFVFFCYY